MHHLHLNEDFHFQQLTENLVRLTCLGKSKVQFCLWVLRSAALYR